MPDPDREKILYDIRAFLSDGSEINTGKKFVWILASLLVAAGIHFCFFAYFSEGLPSGFFLNIGTELIGSLVVLAFVASKENIRLNSLTLFIIAILFAMVPHRLIEINASSPDRISLENVVFFSDIAINLSSEVLGSIVIIWGVERVLSHVEEREKDRKKALAQINSIIDG